jgi:outer membrane protein TolC
LNALDLLDAERVLLEVRTGTERARADLAIALARLEGAIGAPLAAATEGDDR